MVEWFLGTHFQWLVSPDQVSVHLSQIGFATHLVEENNVYERNITPDATPYRSGLLIDAIPESEEDNKDPALIECKWKYQSVVGSIGWLAHSTHPDLAACHHFLTTHPNKPVRSHWNATLYVLHYIHSTIDYGILFISKETALLHAFMHFPAFSDMEVYHNTTSSKDSQHHHLTTYSDPCWGSQLGNSVREGIHLTLFTFCSMSGAIVMPLGGSLSWKANHQERTYLSSCEAEIRATNMGCYLTVNTRNMTSSFHP
jgi:hypothetical protein